MSYHESGALSADEPLCRYEGSERWYRGPERALDVPYVACVGGDETFGRFVARPFPSVLGDKLDTPCINLGSLFCGVDGLTLDSGLQDLMNNATACVLQLPGVLGQTNPFYRVHTRRNDRVLAATADLRALYPEVDFAEIHFVRHLILRLAEFQDARFEMVADTLRRGWLTALSDFLTRVKPPVVLLWLDMAHSPDAQHLSLPEPVRVTASMVEELARLCAGKVEMRVRPSGESDDLEDMLFGTMQQPMAEYMIGPATHRAIAERLLPAIRDLD